MSLLRQLAWPSTLLNATETFPENQLKPLSCQPVTSCKPLLCVHEYQALPMTMCPLPMSHYMLPLSVLAFEVYYTMTCLDVSPCNIQASSPFMQLQYVPLAHVTLYPATGGCSCTWLDGDPSSTLYLASTFAGWLNIMVILSVPTSVGQQL
ncbi:hypothetical protein F5141DRAFT_1067748 [Pisolithus sp. B1]|nr:hypothetical protein F5141DRAFT_1067748 [Pisolithus sp. B1]